MKKVLLITNADMSMQSGNVVLVVRRAEELYRQFGIATVCIVINPRLKDKQIGHSSDALTFFTAGNKKELQAYLKPGEFGMIVFYGEIAYTYMSFVQKKLASDGLKTLIDFQGALEEQIEYSSRKRYALNFVKFTVKKTLFRRAAAKSDGLIVVSDELRDYCMRFLGRKKKDTMRFFKIRCGINGIVPNAQRLEWRRDVRARWGIAETTTVMVYSGYRNAWQKVDDIIAEFKKYDGAKRDVFFAFFCNIDEAFSQKLKESFPKGNYVLDYLPFNHYMEYLCACDVGFLVRDHNMTNKVAFPNKFSDYVNGGLLIALNDALPEPMRLLRASGMGHIDIGSDPGLVFDACLVRLENIEAYYEKCNRLCREELLFENMISNSGIVSMFKNG